jgi:hypothetical protein
MVKIATTIDLDGPFFRHDPAKTFHQNVLVLLEAIAKEGEQDVVAKLRQGQSQRYPIGSAVKPNRVSAHARGRVHSLRGKHWRATAVVSVNNSGFSPRQGIALADNTLKFRATMDDQVSPKLTGIHGKFDQLGKSKGYRQFTQGLGMGAGIAAFNLIGQAVGKVFDVLGDATRAAIEDQQSQAKLGAALVANVKNFYGNTAAIERVLKARMALGFSDDEQRDSLALLVAATGDVTKALTTQRTAMDLARLKGISLGDASEALVKVEAGQFRILKSLGIELANGATQTEALAAVQAVAAGQAEDYSATTSGAVLAMQVQFNELQEEIGQELLPILLELATFAKDTLIPAFSDLIASIKAMPWKEIGLGISATIDFFDRLAERIGAVIGAIQDFNEIFGTSKGKGGAGSFGGGSGSGGTGGSSGFGGGGSIQVNLDGQELHNSNARWAQYSGGNSRLPR